MTRKVPKQGNHALPLALITAFLLGSTLPGCGVDAGPPANPGLQPPRKAAPQPSPAVDEGSSAAGSWGPVLKAKIKVKDGAGKEVFSVKPKDDGAKLVDASEHEIARFNLHDDKLKIKDADDRVLGYIVGSRGKYHVKDPAQEHVLFELQSQADGDWKLKDGHETLVYKIKKRDYGFEIEDSRESSLAKVKTKNGKVELRDASDHVRYTTSSTPVGPMPLACLGLDQVGELPLKAGLMIRVAMDGASVLTPEREPQR